MSTKGDAGNISQNIKDEVSAAGHDLVWLARVTAIPYSTLYKQITYRPDLLTLSTVLKVAGVLNRPVAALIGGTA